MVRLCGGRFFKWHDPKRIVRRELALFDAFKWQITAGMRVS